jgi:membrane-bound lytic murein transglycosylase D
MKLNNTLLTIAFAVALVCEQQTVAAQQHDILFCGEAIPVSNNFVANKLMDIIRKQIPNVNLPSLRNRSLQYFPYVGSYLRSVGLPEDFKYLPIVESGFTLEISNVGARGFWQIMPNAGADMGLVMSANYDERDDIQKSTVAACKLLANYYKMLQKLNNIASWVLTAAAYNFGIGNISKAIKNQGSDYFTMNLNAETAAYVYKIIAVKELFEYPELYMKSFGYNVFSATASKNAPKQTPDNKPATDEAVFKSIQIKVPTKPVEDTKKSVYVTAHITGKYKDFHDGDIVSLILNEDLYVQGGFAKKNEVIKGAGWIIDDRVYIDLSHGHDLTLYDASRTKGIAISALKNNEPILLKNDIFDDKAQWK